MSAIVGLGIRGCFSFLILSRLSCFGCGFDSTVVSGSDLIMFNLLVFVGCDCLVIFLLFVTICSGSLRELFRLLLLEGRCGVFII